MSPSYISKPAKTKRTFELLIIYDWWTNKKKSRPTRTTTRILIHSCKIMKGLNRSEQIPKITFWQNFIDTDTYI